MRKDVDNQLSRPEKWIKVAKQTSTKDKQMIVEKYDRLDTEPRRFLRLHKFHRKNERQALIDLLLKHGSFLPKIDLDAIPIRTST